MTEKQTAVLEKNLQKTETNNIQDMIRKSTKELGRALPSHLNAERLVRIALTSIRLTPELANCTPESLLGSLFVLAQIGIEPIAGRAYLLPFTNKRKIGNDWKSFKEVQAIIGYKGLIELFYRNDAALSIDTQAVYLNDDFHFEYGTNSFLRHIPTMKERGEVIGYYAVAKMRGGASVFKYMTKAECMEHGKKHSKTFNSVKNSFSEYSPWHKEPDAMCKKTVLIQLSKLLPLSVEIQRAISVDETSRSFKEGIKDTLDLPDSTNWQEAEISNEQALTSPPNAQMD
jgi:recombination protein RecT